MQKKANYWKKEFQSSTSAKMFWCTVQKFKGETKSQRIGPFNDDEKIITDDFEKSNLMNEFFANVGKNLSTNHPYLDLNSHYYRVTPV